MDAKTSALVESLTCPLTGAILEDPVVVPCCGRAFTRSALADALPSSAHCPLCHADLTVYGFDANTAGGNAVLAEMVNILHQPTAVLPPHRWNASITPITATPPIAPSSTASSAPAPSSTAPSAPVKAEFRLTLENSRFAPRPTLFVAVLDSSGSMSGGPERQVRTALRHILGLAATAPHLQLVVVSYNSTATEIHTAEDYVIGGGTNFRCAFAAVQTILTRYVCSDDPRDAALPNNVSSVTIAFLTDGGHTDGNCEGLVPEFRQMLQRQWNHGPLSVHALGFSASCDRTLLDQMRTAGTTEGTFRYAEPTDHDDALCQKLTGVFELCSRAATLPVTVSWGSETWTLQFPVDAQGYGEYRRWVDATLDDPPRVVLNTTLDAHQDLPLSIYPPSAEVFQRWLAHAVDRLAGEIVALTQKTLSPNLRDLHSALLLQTVERVSAQTTQEAVHARLKYLESQIREFQIGNALNLGKLHDLQFASQFAAPTALAPAVFSAIAPVEQVVSVSPPPGPAPERPLIRYNFNSAGKARNALQEAIMALRGDRLTDIILLDLAQSTLAEVIHVDVDGNNALMLAAYAGHSQVIAALLKRHPQLPLDAENRQHETALTLAVKRRGFYRSAALLHNAGATLPRAAALERFALSRGHLITAQWLGKCGQGSLDVDDSLTPEAITYIYDRAREKNAVNVPQFWQVALGKRMLFLVQTLLEDYAVQPTLDHVQSTLPKRPDAPDLETCLQLTRLLCHARPALLHERTAADGDTVLHCAAQRGSLPHIQFFVERGAAVDAVNFKGNTALFVACFAGWPLVAEYLLDHGANVNVVNGKGNPLLYGPCTRGHKAVAELLLARGAPTDAVNGNGDTLVLICVRNGQHEMLRWLLNYVEPAYANQAAHIDGFNAMLAAAEQDRPECVRVCHEYGLDLNVTTAADNAILGGATPLHVCSYYGRPKALRALLELGAAPNRRDRNGQTPLHVAVIQGHVELIKMLRLHGADLGARDAAGHPPMAYCRDNTQVRQALVNPLLDILMRWIKGCFSAEESAETNTILSQWRGIEGCLVPRDVVDVTDVDGSTPLLQAVLMGQTKAVSTLVSLGAHSQHPNVYGLSALDWARWLRLPRMVQALGGERTPSSLALDRLHLLSSADRQVLFLGLPPAEYRAVSCSGIAQRMEAFVNAPQRLEERRAVPPRAVPWADGERALRSIDDAALPHRLWDAKILVTSQRAAKSDHAIPIADALLLALLTNTTVLHQRLNAEWLGNAASENAISEHATPMNASCPILLAGVIQALTQLPPFLGETFLGSATVQRQHYTVGTEFVWNHVVSSSALWRVALENTPCFSTKSRKGTVFIIQSRSGRYMGPYSPFSFDAEVMFLPGTRFRVTHWYHGDPIALGQANIREHTFGVKEHDTERLNRQQLADSDKALLIELVEI